MRHTARSYFFALGGIRADADIRRFREILMTNGTSEQIMSDLHNERRDGHQYHPYHRTAAQGICGDIPQAALTTFLTSTPKGPEKFATILSREAKQLLAMVPGLSFRYSRKSAAPRSPKLSPPSSCILQVNSVIHH
jgi:hypothetical protein